MTTSNKNMVMPSRRAFNLTYLVGLIGMVSMVALIWAPFGLKRAVGLFEEWGTERHPTNPFAHVITHDPTRPFSYAPFVLAQSLLPNSFAGHNLFMMLLFILKGVIVYKLIYRLMPHDRFLGFLTACLFVIYPADTGLMTFRAINIHTSITLGLLSIYLLVAQWQHPQKWRRCMIVILQLMSLGIYEVMYGILLAAPVLLWWQERHFSRRLIRATLLWWVLPIAMASRAAYYILNDRANYVNQQLDDGTKAHFTFDTLRDSLTQMIERHFTAWGYVVDTLSWSSPYLIYAMLAGGVVALAAWRHWQKGEATQIQWQWKRPLVLLVAGLGLMILSFAPYLPTPYRNETFRVFYLSSLGAALIVATLVQWGASWLRRYGKIPAAAMTGLLVMLASFHATNQLAYFVHASDAVQHLLAGILTVAPSVPDNTMLIFVDESMDYQDEWHLASSTATLNAALQFLYFDDYQHARFCTINVDRPFKTCLFRPDVIVHVDEAGTATTIPYAQAVVIRVDYHGGFELVETIPEEYLLRSSVWEDHLSEYDPHGLIDEDAAPPARAHTFFACWPVADCLPPLATTSTPQTHFRLEFDAPIPGMGWERPYGVSASWTLIPKAVIHLNIVPNQAYAIQFSTIGVIDPTILDSLTLSVNGTAIPLRRGSLDDGATLFQGRIPAEAIAPNPQNTTLLLATNRVVIPQELGLNNDPRPLGVRYDWLQLEPIGPSARFEFDRPVAGLGWSAPEASQIWTSSTTSTLAMWVDTTQALTAEFHVTYALTPDIIDSLQFFANEVALPLERQPDGGGGYVYRTTIPPDVLAASEPDVVHLKFTIATTISPQALGLSNDARELGVLFDWIELRPTP